MIFSLPEDQVRLDRRREEAVARYPRLFAQAAAAWNSPGPDDRAWLLYSANYIFRTGGVRWAMDPLTMRWRVPETPVVEISHIFDRLDFVLLTHRHADHLDFDLLRALRHLPIRWVIPDYLLPQVLAEAALPADRITAPHPGQPFEIEGILSSRLQAGIGKRLQPDAGLRLVCQRWGTWSISMESAGSSRVTRGITGLAYYPGWVRSTGCLPTCGWGADAPGWKSPSVMFYRQNRNFG